MYLNGKLLGNHTGGYDGFSFDLTPGLKPTDNELFVVVYDPSDSGTSQHSIALYTCAWALDANTITRPFLAQCSLPMPTRLQGPSLPSVVTGTLPMPGTTPLLHTHTRYLSHHGTCHNRTAAAGQATRCCHRAPGW